MKPNWLLCLLLVGCSKGHEHYGSEARQLRAIGDVPQSIKLAAAEALRSCSVPVEGSIFMRWEGPSDRAPYTLELPQPLFKDERVTSCLATELKSLAVEREIDLGAEPPPPPKA